MCDVLIKLDRQHFGKDKHVVAYPISKGRYINFVSLISFPEQMGSKLEGNTMVEVPVSEMANHHVGWEPQVQQLISVGYSLDLRL